MVGCRHPRPCPAKYFRPKIPRSERDAKEPGHVEIQRQRRRDQGPRSACRSASRRVYRRRSVPARDGAPLRQHLGLCRPRQPGTESGRLFWDDDRSPARADGAPHRQHGEGPVQPLPAQGHAHHHRDLRQHRQVLPVSLPCVELPDRRLADRHPAARRIREHRLRTEPRGERHERRPPRPQLSRLRLRQAQRRWSRLRGVFRR